MKNGILGLSTIAILLLSTSIVDAKLLLSGSDWSIRKVNAEKPYCTLSREYKGNIQFTIAKNASGEGTLALDFNRDAFDVSRAYPVKFSANGLSREYSVNPANQSVIIMRLGRDEELFTAISDLPSINVTIDQETFEVDLSGTKNGMQDFSTCLGGVTQKVATRSVIPPQTVSSQDVVNQNSQISELLLENRRLTELLSKASSKSTPISVPQNDPMVAQLTEQLEQEKKKNVVLISQVEKLEKDLASINSSINPDLSSVISEKNKQIELLMSQNSQLNTNLAVLQNKKSEVVVKEIIKEVPVAVSGDTLDATLKLAEAKAKASSLEAERDEYRRLLQTERRRLREGINVAGQVNDVTSNENNLVLDVRRLEKEKAELARQLEHAKKTESVVDVPSQNTDTTNRLNKLSQKLSEAQKKLAESEYEKQSLEKRMAVIDLEAIAIQRQLTETKIAKLADDRPEIIREELEAKTLRSEIAALKAQSDMLQVDIGAKKQTLGMPSEPVSVVKSISKNNVIATNKADYRQELRDRLKATQNNIVSRPVLPTQMADLSQVQPRLKNQSLPNAMQILSGDKIRQLVSQSKIPLQSSVDRIDRLSGPDFAAFSWDTGFVYGSGEQSRLSDVSEFNNSVQRYIQKTASRCEGSFDQNIQALNASNGMTVKSADIACVDDNAEGSAASILFFIRDGMFYALAHEADMDSFKVAMDMRDRLAGSIDKIF